MPFAEIPEILDELKAGRMIILCDAEDRENEGDLVCPAEFVTPEKVAFMATQGRGLICLALTPNRCDQLHLHPQAATNTAALGTAFTVSIDARDGITTGISAADRAHTILMCLDERTTPSHLARPGHVFPLRSRTGGVLVRAGQTEGAVDMMRLAGLYPAGVICEIMNDDGTMARVGQLTGFARKHGLKMGTIADLIRYRLRHEHLIERAAEVDLPTAYGTFRLCAYKSLVDPEPHLALCMGGVGDRDEQGEIIQHGDPVLVRVHSQCLTGDIFGSRRCECGDQLHSAMQQIAEAGKGAIVYLRQEGRGIGLLNKLHAYRLQQEEGLDTVEANEALGFEADRRDYGVGAQILRDLGLRKLRILTNNKRKIHGLQGYGLEITERVGLRIAPNIHNENYLATKRDKLGHIL